MTLLFAAVAVLETFAKLLFFVTNGAVLETAEREDFMNQDKLDSTIKNISDKIDHECNNHTGNGKEIFMLSRALAELVSVRASLPTN
mgnify:CR=1 FL=1